MALNLYKGHYHHHHHQIIIIVIVIGLVYGMYTVHNLCPCAEPSVGEIL